MKRLATWQRQCSCSKQMYYNFLTSVPMLFTGLENLQATGRDFKENGRGSNPDRRSAIAQFGHVMRHRREVSFNSCSDAVSCYDPHRAHQATQHITEEKFARKAGIESLYLTTSTIVVDTAGALSRIEMRQIQSYRYLMNHSTDALNAPSLPALTLGSLCRLRVSKGTFV